MQRLGRAARSHRLTFACEHLASCLHGSSAAHAERQLGACRPERAAEALRRPQTSRGFAAQAAPDAVPVDPFSIVTDELDAVSQRMRAAVVSEVRACERF